MRVAWVSYDFGEYSIPQANAIAADHDVLLVVTSHDIERLGSTIDPRVTVCSFNRPRLRQPLHQYQSIRKIVRRIHRFEPDVVHFQNGHLWFNLALRSMRRYPLVITIHDPRHHEGDRTSRRTPQSIMDYGFRRADRVIVHGQQLLEDVVSEVGIRREQVHVIPHVAMGKPELDRQVVEDESSLLFFGRIWEYKGLEYLIKAEPLISRQIGGVRVVIAGHGEDFDKYRRMMVHPDRFLVHNHWISDEQRGELFAQSAAVVLPYTSATQSGVVPIAYAYGKPVVATRVGALPECVEHGRTGLLVPPRDEHALADAVVHLLKHPQLRRELGQNGRRKLREWSPEIVGAKTVNVYQRAIDDRMASRHAGSEAIDNEPLLRAK